MKLSLPREIIDKNNLCYQLGKPFILDSWATDCDDPQIQEILTKDDDVYVTGPVGQKEEICDFGRHSVDSIEYTKPPLIRCKEGQDPGYYYQNCCPAEEYDELMNQLHPYSTEIAEIKEQLQILEADSNTESYITTFIFIAGFTVILILIFLLIYFIKKNIK